MKIECTKREWSLIQNALFEFYDNTDMVYNFPSFQCRLNFGDGDEPLIIYGQYIQKENEE